MGWHVHVYVHLVTLRTSITTSEPRAGQRKGAIFPNPRPEANRTIEPSWPL